MTDPSNLNLQLALPGGFGGDTRVMSPNPDVNDALLIGYRTPCCRCHEPADEPVLCSQCGAMGHPRCLKMAYVGGYPFCSDCVPTAITKFHEFDNQVQQDAWRAQLANQIGSWKSWGHHGSIENQKDHGKNLRKFYYSKSRKINKIHT